MKEIKEQTEEKAQRIEMGSLKGKYTEENYPFIYTETPFFTTKPIFKWVTILGERHQEYDHEEMDYSRYEADDGTFIDSKLCRSCRKEIKPYKEIYYKKEFEYNVWNNYRISCKSGYCKECALKKAVIVNIGWDSSIAVDTVITSIRDDEEVRTKIMCDGSVIEEMTVREKNYRR